MEFRFGIYPEEDFKNWWGCRAIFNSSTNFNLDIPFDRKNAEFKSEETKKEFLQKAEEIIKEIAEKIDEDLYHKQGKIEYEDERFYAIADCKKSYGYLYLGIWEKAD